MTQSPAFWAMSRRLLHPPKRTITPPTTIPHWLLRPLSQTSYRPKDDKPTSKTPQAPASGPSGTSASPARPGSIASRQQNTLPSRSTPPLASKPSSVFGAAVAAAATEPFSAQDGNVGAKPAIGTGNLPLSSNSGIGQNFAFGKTATGGPPNSWAADLGQKLAAGTVQKSLMGVGSGGAAGSMAVGVLGGDEQPHQDGEGQEGGMEGGRGKLAVDYYKPFKFSVFAHKQNTHITVAKPDGQAIVSMSSGNIGFRKANRKKYDAAYQLAAFVLDQLYREGWHDKISNLELSLRGFGQGREAVTKALIGYEGRLLKKKWVRVSDSTRLKFGGTRSMNPRRLG